VFSVSLNVKDIQVSKLFNDKLDFEIFGGDASQNWLILMNGDHVIALFQGMFDSNLLTFNQGWDSNASAIDNYTEVRVIQRQLKERGLEMIVEADESTSGPACFTIVDPDGNPFLVDHMSDS